MRLGEFLCKFYRRSGERPLGIVKMQNDIGYFFAVTALPEKYHDDFLPHDESTYGKWMKGTLPNKQLMNKIQEHFEEEKLRKALYNNLNDNLLEEMMKDFGIPDPSREEKTKERFAAAVATQYKALMEGEGEAKNIVPAEFRKRPVLSGHHEYLSLAAKKYKFMHLPGENDSLLSDYYVYNDLGTMSAAFPRRTRPKGIEKATLEIIRKHTIQNRTSFVFLIGPCGFGKTMMLQQLFLDARMKYEQTGLLPVFAELRNFSNRYNNFVDFIVDTIHEFDPSFDSETVILMLKNGQIQLLLDGLDELDPDEVPHFQSVFSTFCSRYSENQIVLSSRQCPAMKAIHHFERLYLQPLDDEQIEELIDKLLPSKKYPDAKKNVLAFIDAKGGYVPKNSFIASNPLLLTIIARNYQKLSDYQGDRAKFYKLLYDELIRGHDEEKTGYKRFFHSVSDDEEFTEVFREFCAQAYVDGVDQFDERLFERYFKILQKRVTLKNPAAFKLHAFQHDVCATACMMYEQETDIYYVDLGFQDYMFAEYYYHADSNVTKQMGRALEKRDIDSFRNLNALRMLYGMVKDKVEVNLLLPYLQKLFKGKTKDEALVPFLDFGFGNLVYTAINELETHKAAERVGMKLKKITVNPAANHVSSIMMRFVLDILKLPNSFIVGTITDTLVRDQYVKYYYVGYPIAIKESYDEPGYWLVEAQKRSIEKIEDTEFYVNKNIPAPLCDEQDKPLCIGYEYSLLPKETPSRPDILEMLHEAGEGMKPEDIFLAVWEFYQDLAKKQKENKYR